MKGCPSGAFPHRFQQGCARELYPINPIALRSAKHQTSLYGGISRENVTKEE